MPILHHLEHALQTISASRTFLIDMTWSATGTRKPVIVFVHGFKGFKDWGPFPEVARYLAENGFVCIKMNQSHNGTTPEAAYDFADLEAFGQNNVTLQLQDVQVVLQFVRSGAAPFPEQEADSGQVYLIGHSRGGSLVMLAAARHPQIKKVVTWSAVADLRQSYTALQIEKWKTEGVLYVDNARTKQQMPVYYQYYEDLQQYDVLQAATHLRQPCLILHGDKDETVPVSDAFLLHKNCQHSRLHLVKGANHTFGASHPASPSGVLPEHLMQVLDATTHFLKTS